MKLTINRVALGSIKRRRGQYKAMILGAGLAIFFVSVLFLSLQSVYETYRLSHVGRVGDQDVILRDAENVTPEALLEGGMARAVGRVYVLGETEDSGCPIGYYDEQGAETAGRQLTEGRLPKQVGEIAVEPNFLQRLRSEAKPGDDIELMLKIPRGVEAEFLPEPVKKTYRIVGVLKPQSPYLEDNMQSDGEYLRYPSAIVSDKEQVELGGRAIVHRMVKLAPGVRFEQFNEYAMREFWVYNAMHTSFALFAWTYYQGYQENTEGQIMIIIAAILGIVLVLAACLGIVNAFAGSLSERRGQIGMMRAVGATSKQIRSIFGREAMLLAVLIAPVSIALSYGFVLLLTGLMGSVVFYANPWFLPVDFLAAMLCVVLASWIPLLSASKLPPMQAIREVSLLRAKKRIRVKAKRQYDAPRLIASRYLTLYKTRQAGIAVMVALSMLLISGSLPIALDMWVRPNPYAYQVVRFRRHMDYFVETGLNPHAGLTDADVAEARALPLVSSVDTVSHAQVNLLVDRVTPYIIAQDDYDFYEPAADPDETAQQEIYQKFKAAQRLSQEAIPGDLYGCEEDFLMTLAPLVTEGKIDMAALNAGREVLCVAPQAYYTWEEPDRWGGIDGETSYKPIPGKPDATRYANDMFHAGDALPLLRLSTRGEVLGAVEFDYVTGLRREDATPRIGAILSEDAYDRLSDNLLFWFSKPGMLLTTHAGMAALGFETAGYINLNARLEGSPDDATLKYLNDQFVNIAARGTEMELNNNIQTARDDSFWQMVAKACLVAVLVLLMSMCVSLINNAITSRVRSDKRAIGTLRAVGAPLGDIVRSYRIQALTMLLWGVVAGVGLSCGLYLWYYLVVFFPTRSPFNLPFGSVALAQVAFLGAVALLCGINLSLRVREIMRGSIVSNIREL